MYNLDLTELLLNKGLYDSVEITDQNSALNTLMYFEENQLDKTPSLQCYCKHCKIIVSFLSLNSDVDLKHYNILPSTTKPKFSTNSLNNDYKNINLNTDSLKDLKNKLSQENYFIREFKCPHASDNSHNIVFILKVIDNKIMKIGQYPSFNDLNRNNLDKIRKFNPDIYREMNMASGLFSHGVGVGSYVYLRRILEKYIVQPKFDIKIIQDSSPPDISNYKFKDKVKYVEDEISNFLSKNNKVYGFISKGLHELEEKECIQFFSLVYETIVMILEEEIEIKERKKKMKEIQKQIDKL